MLQPRTVEVTDFTLAERCQAKFSNETKETVRVWSYNRHAGRAVRTAESAHQRYELRPGESSQVEALDGQTAKCRSFVVELRNRKDWWWGRRTKWQHNVQNGGSYVVRADWQTEGARRAAAPQRS